MEARFEVPIFSIEMCGDFGPDSQKGLVDLSLQDLVLVYHRAGNYVSSFDLSLKSLTMEDLLQKKDSKHRYLMLSSQKEDPEPKDENVNSLLSTSCPDCTIMVPKPRMPGSLPSSFHEENVFMTHSKKNTSTTTRRKMTRKEQKWVVFFFFQFNNISLLLYYPLFSHVIFYLLHSYFLFSLF